MAKPNNYYYLKYTQLLLSALLLLLITYLIVNANTNGFFLPKFAFYVTFVGICLCALLLLGSIAVLINSIILLTSFGVTMGITFIISLVATIGAVIFQLLTPRSFVYAPFVPIIVILFLLYCLTMIPLALKDIVRSLDVTEGGEWDSRANRTFSPPLTFPYETPIL